MSSILRRILAKGVLRGVGLSEQLVTTARQWLLQESAELDPTCRIYRSARIESLSGDPSAIRIGAHTHVRGLLLTAAHGGRISIGEWCYIGEGSRLWSASSLTIGDRVLVSHGCEIHDWNAHPLDAEKRHAHFRGIIERGHPRASDGSDGDSTETAPIVIKDDAWIGFGSTIMKGVTIGARSVIASRSLVLEDVPDDVLVAGSPARVIRSI